MEITALSMLWEQVQRPAHGVKISPRSSKIMIMKIKKIGTNLYYSRMKDGLKKGLQYRKFSTTFCSEKFLVKPTDCLLQNKSEFKNFTNV